MNPETKHVEEKLIMLCMRKDYMMFPGGRLSKSESPDFILKTTGKKKIGLELTRLHETTTNLTGNKNQDHQLIGKLINKSMLYFEAEQKIPLYIKFYFSYQHLPGENDLEFYAKFLSLFIRKAIAGKSLTKYRQISLTKDLPDFLTHIQIIFHPEFKDAFWDNGKTFLIFDLQKEMIETNIRGKEEKLKLYRKNHLNQYWLIIYTMRLNPEKNFNIFNKFDNWNFDTLFDKILFYEVFGQKVFEI